VASEWATRQSHVEWLLEAYDSNRIYRSRYVVAPRLGPMLDLLVRDSEHPRALAFQARAIARDLETLATSLGITGEMGLDEAIPQLTDAKLTALEADGAEAEQARRAMSDRLRALSWAAGQLSRQVVAAALFAHHPGRTGAGDMKGTVRYHIRHETAYEYHNDVVHSHHTTASRPRPTAYQQCLEHVINVTPGILPEAERD